MNVPGPTPVYRLIRIDNLEVCLKRGGFFKREHITIAYQRLQKKDGFSKVAHRSISPATLQFSKIFQP